MEHIKSICKFTSRRTFVFNKPPIEIRRANKQRCALCKHRYPWYQYLYICSKCEQQYCIFHHRQHLYANHFASTYSIDCTSTKIDVAQFGSWPDITKQLKPLGKHFKFIHISCRHDYAHQIIKSSCFKNISIQIIQPFR